MLALQAVVVKKFSSCLKDEVAKREGDETGKTEIVLCSRRCAFCIVGYEPMLTRTRLTSIGGLVAADALIGFAQKRPDARSPLFPRIIACLSYDTPVCPGPHPSLPRFNVILLVLGTAQQPFVL